MDFLRETDDDFRRVNCSSIISADRDKKLYEFSQSLKIEAVRDYRNEDDFMRVYKVKKRNSLLTVLQNVYQTQTKKKFSY